MKQLFAMFAVAVVFAACGSGETKAPAVDSAKLADSIKAAQAADSTKKDSSATMAMDSTKKDSTKK